MPRISPWPPLFFFTLMAGLFWLAWRNRRDGEAAMEAARHELETGLSSLRERLSAYKLEVAKSYASIAYMKDVERRLTAHLVRIENKLDLAGHPPLGGPGHG